MPISIPEVYEHFLGEDRLGDMLGMAAPLQPQATEAPTSAPQGAEPGAPPEPSLATAEQLNLVLRPAGACHGGPMACPHPGNTLFRDVSQDGHWGGAGQDPSQELGAGLKDGLGRRNQFLATPGHSPGGAAQARSFRGLAVH